MKIKCLSIVAPSGTKIAMGKKKIEVRSWLPNVTSEDDLLIIENNKFLRSDNEIDLNGKAVAIVKVRNTRPFIKEDISAACASYWASGYYSWELFDIRKCQYNGPIIAKRGLYEIELGPEKLILEN